MSSTLPDQLIDRLRAHAAPGAALGLRLTLGAALAQADLRPPGLPPGAVLIVWRLADPLPGGLGGGNGQWERAARNALAALYQRAARPALGPVPDTAEAVIFADEAELLACLAGDLAGGWAATRWWWRSSLRDLPPGPAGLAPLLAARGAMLPAALALLADHGEAARVLAAMDPAGAHTVFTALCRAYEAPGLPAAIAPRLLGAAAALAGSTQIAGLSSDPQRPIFPALASLPAGTKLAPEARCLLGVALVLHRDPGAARSPTFAARLATWWLAGAPDESLLEDRRKEAFANPSFSGQLAPQQPGTTWLTQAAQVPPAIQAPPGYVQTNHEAFVRLRAEEAHSSSRAQRVVPGAAGPLERAPEEPQPASPTTIVEQGLATAVGGLLYLVNMMRRLALPSIFEDTWGLASGAGGWGVLEAIGRGLLAPRHDALAADSLWRALAALARRDPSDPLGAAVTPGPTILPAAWEPFAHGAAVPLPAQSPLLAPLAPAIAAWLSLALPAIRRCLLVTLSAGPPKHAQLGADDDPVGDLLVRPAAVYITNTHVDAVMSLESISLRARLAGLDRDPGWVPDLGRVVRFHFD